MAWNDLSESKMANMDPVMEPIFTKMILCPGVGILKMTPSSAARPRTEKYMSTPRDMKSRGWVPKEAPQFSYELTMLI